ncbi:helix-turn-helix transcriptional regulator [Nocardioides euryhalodurans]|uniref:YafY family transcriptional regulator n=1 Tax=Nocardioides euryhalodurans TaxID=2518370 RepID=A0A4P7GPK6_9ACTN|nr:YafY family protein [Nocardioides euryhalodurans]QBR93731.1 YafY family transcriptional regulator [Nocardioides euryhalodurans]
MANTSARTLRLLSLLQTHRFWPGTELAGRLEVSMRTLRRDIDRLRELGYPVHSNRGVEGGYQLAPGGSMPPLVVDEEEAIAMVVALGGTASAFGGALSEASLSALAKVVQVLPGRLRRRAESLRAATVDAPFSQAPEVEAGVLATLAQAIRDQERVRFGYTARGGSAPGEELRRHVEPHRMVTVGRRWYLVGYDLDRQDWRSFRLDRLAEPAGTKAIFRPRDVPGGDAAAYVRAGLSRGESLRLTVSVAAPRPHVERRIGPWATIVAEEDGGCRLEIEATDPRWVAFGLAYLEAPVTLVDAPESVVRTLREWSQRLGETAATAG